MQVSRQDARRPKGLVPFDHPEAQIPIVETWQHFDDDESKERKARSHTKQWMISVILLCTYIVGDYLAFGCCHSVMEI